MKKFLLIYVFIGFAITGFAQNNKVLDPYSSLFKILNSSKYGTSNNLNFTGQSKVGIASGESLFDFSKSKKDFPNLIITYNVFLYNKIKKAIEGGSLKNLKFINSKGGYNTKSIIADWVNFDKGYGSGQFELTVYGEKYPNLIYMGISGKGFEYWVNIEVDPLKFQEIVNHLTISGTPINVVNYNESLNKLKKEEILISEKNNENERKKSLEIINAEKNYQEIKEKNVKNAILVNLNVGESYLKNLCIYKSDDKKYNIITNNWKLESGPYSWITEQLNELGEDWHLLNLKEAKLFIKNNNDFNLKFPTNFLLIKESNTFYIINNQDKIIPVDLSNENIYQFLAVKYYGDLSQIKY